VCVCVCVSQLYQTTEFQQRITAYVTRAMNHAYCRFRELHPLWDGQCSVIGHSLGSVIGFDILAAQVGDREGQGQGQGRGRAPADTAPSAPPCPACPEDGDGGSAPAAALFASQSYMTQGRAAEGVSNQQLTFSPRAFYAIGSPIGKHSIA
jgi:hypothetical protein